MKISKVAAALLMASATVVYAQDDLGTSPSESAAAATPTPDTNRGVPDTIGERFYIAPMASYVFADSDRGTDDGLGATLLLGKLFESRFGVELALHYSEYHAEMGGETAKLTSGGVRGLLFPVPKAGAFVTGGLGYGKFKKHPGSDPDYNTILWTVGGGYMFGPFDLLLRDLSVRTEVVFRGDMHDGEQTSETFNNALNELVASVGVMIPLGTVAAPPPPPPLVEPAVEVVPLAEPVDSDGDGVTDDLDQCPDTPTGTTVGADGCPLPAPEPAPAADCKAPTPGQPITLEGCAAGDKIVLRGVNFEFDRAQLTPNARTILDGVSEALASAPNVRVEIGGHTDGKGSDEYNQNLSERRAASVVQYLTGKGVDSSRLESRGYGEAEPVADNKTDEGRELNRRVELKIID